LRNSGIRCHNCSTQADIDPKPVGILTEAEELTCRTRSPVFWKRTDHAYFLFAILGGASGAADLAFNNWTKQSEQIQVTMLTNGMLLRGYVSSAISICDKQKARAKERAQFGPDVINPNKEQFETFAWKGKWFSLKGEHLPDFLSVRDCIVADIIWSDIQNGSLQNSVKYGIRPSSLENPSAQRILRLTST
jgi:hypothetical protein